MNRNNATQPPLCRRRSFDHVLAVAAFALSAWYRARSGAVAHRVRQRLFRKTNDRAKPSSLNPLPLDQSHAYGVAVTDCNPPRHAAPVQSSVHFSPIIARPRPARERRPASHPQTPERDCFRFSDCTALEQRECFRFCYAFQAARRTFESRHLKLS